MKFVRNTVDPTSADDIKFKLSGATVVFVHETIKVINTLVMVALCCSFYPCNLHQIAI